jgi:hypothetical protein
MEIKELVSFYINEVSETLDVSFRLIDDSEDEIREDQINLTEVGVFGYNFRKNLNLGLFDDEDEDFDDFDDFDDFELHEEFEDDYEIISFLNEYYLIYPDKLPNVELF